MVSSVDNALVQKQLRLAQTKLSSASEQSGLVKKVTRELDEQQKKEVGSQLS